MTTMKLILILTFTVLFNFIKCYDLDSVESYNGIGGLSPFHDAIIFSDIADIVNEFENKNIPITNIVKNERESESDEDVDDLLSEYQSHLEKAHQQTKAYLEKSKLKNKIPLLKHEKFTKNNLLSNKQHDEYIERYGTPNIFEMKSITPLDVVSFVRKVFGSQTTTEKQNLNTYKEIMFSAESPFPSSLPKNPKKSCYCKNNKLPCTCDCKQCLIKMDSLYWDDTLKATDEKKKVKLETVVNTDNNFTDISDDDALKIRVKVDVQLPKIIQQALLKNREKAELNIDNARDISAFNKFPHSYFDFPLSMNTFGFKKISDYDSIPMVHKLTIQHKKKKSKINTGNKKHRKKMITFHNIKIDPQQLFEAHFGKQNLTSESKTETPNLNITEAAASETSLITEKLEAINNTESHTEGNIFIMVNITSTPMNGTEESSKTDNSVETDYPNVTDRSTHTLKKRQVTHILPEKREIKQETTANPTKITTTNTLNITKNSTIVTKTPTNVKVDKGKSKTKKIEKDMPSDDELTYWPKDVTGKGPKSVTGQITAMILESENKKAKITSEALRNSHITVLEKAIFGDVDWNNINLNSVAPAFISFVGKYITGVLTMCSDHDCHSMKCGREMCSYRVCKPSDRINGKGHCTTNTNANNSDSVTSMTSIMDLPSNVAYEIVDILEKRMIGKLFGKVTLCISSKCITFSAYKKTFLKNKCALKGLNVSGHCKNVKEVKVK